MAPRSRDTDAPAAAQPQLSAVDAMAQLSFVIYGMLERRAHAHDLSLIQTRLLGVLRDREPTMHELARLLELEKSSVTGLVDRAERRGLVERVRSATDGRAVLVGLTQAGRSLVSAAAAGFGADVETLLEHVPEADRERLVGLVTEVLVGHAAGHGINLLGGL
jgi:MarR family transcriptional regulator, lower aerobic nicotinate degradation pathway regulator